MPDVYTGRLGMSYGLLPEQGVSVSLGGRVDGIPYHDLIGKSDGFRRPSVIVFLDPAVALERGPNTFTFSSPIRMCLPAWRARTCSRGRAARSAPAISRES